MTQWRELVEYFDSNDDYSRESCPEVAPRPQTMDVTLGDEKAHDNGRESFSTDKAKGVVAEDEEPEGQSPAELAGCEVSGKKSRRTCRCTDSSARPTSPSSSWAHSGSLPSVWRSDILVQLTKGNLAFSSYNSCTF